MRLFNVVIDELDGELTFYLMADSPASLLLNHAFVHHLIPDLSG